MKYNINGSYSLNFIKIYFWQGLSLIFNFISMFIVIPFLTSNKYVYGVYTICISLSLFLAYADLGFLGAGQKYAAECYSKGDKIGEIKNIGFSSFVLLLILIIFSFSFIFLSFYPDFLIKGMIQNSEQYNIASKILKILAIFTPVTFFQRISQMIFAIRLEDFIAQRINIISNLIKIVSVYYFFRNSSYNIIGYFFFIQFMNLIASLSTLFLAKKRYNFDFKALINSISFNKEIFNRSKSLAFTSLYLMFTWILYYECDSTVIGKIAGADKVAIFAIGTTILTFFRTLFGIFFSPFNVRFNHFIGSGELERLKSLFISLTRFSMYVTFVPVMVIFLLSKNIILTWVGVNYFDSIMITKLLILGNIYAFLLYPTSLLLVAQERTKELYIINTIVPCVYWIGICIFYQYSGILTFAYFKFIVFTINTIFYIIILKKYIKISYMFFIKKYILPIIAPAIFLFLIYNFSHGYLPILKSKTNLLITAIYAVGLTIVTYLFIFSTSKFIRENINRLALNFKNIPTT